MRVGLVGCVKTKVAQPAKARDLYSSTLFRGRRGFVESSCDRWFVLSAKHGLVSPDEIIEPYDETLNDKSTAAKQRWADHVLRQLEALRVDFPHTVFEIHAGAHYRNFGLANGLRSRGASVEIPAEHLGQGEQLAFYSRAPTAAASGVPASRATAAPAGRATSVSRTRRGGAYAPLADYLAEADGLVVQLTFTQVERILGRSLPASARRHRAWWSNESSGTHSHAAAWMASGWLVDGVDFNTGRVRFCGGRR